jgi:hypothetical protein
MESLDGAWALFLRASWQDFDVRSGVILQSLERLAFYLSRPAKFLAQVLDSVHIF